MPKKRREGPSERLWDNISQGPVCIVNSLYYPAFVNLKGKRCAVVGGGKVAERKVLSLLRSGARVKVISPAITRTLEKQKSKGGIEHIEREYRKGDLKGIFLAVAATSDVRVNARISHDAPCLVNVADRPEQANFIVPSLVKRGPLTIAVSTSGASPAAAKTIRKELEVIYGKGFGLFLGFLKGLRTRAVKEITDKTIRESFLKGVASEECFAVLREKGLREAKKMIMKRMRHAKAESQK